MDKITIKNLRLRCLIGINPDELKEKQDIILNVSYWYDFSSAIKSDKISDTVNYGEINNAIIRLVEESKYNLAETLAGKIADLCMDNPKIYKVRVRVEKTKALKSAESVGAEITKKREK